MQDIKDYLLDANRTIEDGLELLKPHTNNNHLLRIIEIRKDQMKLDLALLEVAGIEEDLEMPVADKITPVISIDQVTAESQAIADKMAIQLKDICNQRCILSNQTADLEGEALVAKTDEVLAKRDEYNALAVKYKAISSGKSLEEEHPDTEGEKKIDVAKTITAEVAIIQATLNPLREKASKLRAKIKDKPTNQKLAVWQTELEQTTKSIEDLEAKKKALDPSN